MILSFYTSHLSVSAILFCHLQNLEPLVCPLISLTDSSVFSFNSFSFLSSFQHNAFSFTWVIAPSLLSGKCILSSSHFTWLTTQQTCIWVKDHYCPPPWPRPPQSWSILLQLQSQPALKSERAAPPSYSYFHPVQVKMQFIQQALNLEYWSISVNALPLNCATWLQKE